MPATTVASTQASGVTFTTIPARVVAGQPAAVTITVKKAGASCSLTVRYADGQVQAGLNQLPALTGHVTWRWVVDNFTAAGKATVTASCGAGGRVSRTMLIVGSLIPPKIIVEKGGFSIRAKYGGTNLSWGLVLRNTSPNADAVRITLLLNFVMADNRALGTQTSPIDTIAAGSLFYLGGEIHFPGGAPIVRLEPVIQIAGRQPKQAFFPSMTSVVVEQNTTDPGWVSDVAGELINDDPPFIFSRASLSAVVFDSAGNVLGGGKGFAGASLPPGTRQVFKLTQGFDPIPMDKAAYALVSTMPHYSR